MSLTLDLIAANPSVDYHVYKTRDYDWELPVTKDLPEILPYEHIDELYLKSKNYCTPEFVLIMQLCC